MTRQILRTFDDHFVPQEIGVAENMFSRFIAGEEVRYIATDYGYPEKAVFVALRFFFLKARGNVTVLKVYKDYRRRKVIGNHATFEEAEAALRARPEIVQK